MVSSYPAFAADEVLKHRAAAREVVVAAAVEEEEEAPDAALVRRAAVAVRVNEAMLAAAFM